MARLSAEPARTRPMGTRRGVNPDGAADRVSLYGGHVARALTYAVSARSAGLRPSRLRRPAATVRSERHPVTGVPEARPGSPAAFAQSGDGSRNSSTCRRSTGKRAVKPGGGEDNFGRGVLVEETSYGYGGIWRDTPVEDR